MSEQIPSEEAISDTTVAQYLSDNPQFFSDKDQLLMDMVIPHESGQAISLLERQVNLLRERSNEHQENINNFIANAAANDELFKKIRSIIISLLETTTLKELSSLIEQRLKDDFSASISKLYFVKEGSEESELEENSSILPLEAAKKALGDLFDKKKSFCGSLVTKQRELLFPEVDIGIISAAIIPIQLADNPESGMPLLVIGSDKENQFHSNLDTLFLDFIGEVLAVHISGIK